MKNIILATNNTHKKEKLAWIMQDITDSVSSMPEKIDVEEDGITFVQNAEIKASAVSKRFNEFSIATDGGAEIPALGVRWNSLLTRRFLGKADITDWDRIEGLLELMKDLHGNDRRVVWREAIAISDPTGKIIFSKEVEGDTGLIQTEYSKKQYKEGIWLCTLWSYPQFGGRNFFDLNEEEIKEGEISWWKLKDAAVSYFESKKI